MDIDAKEVLSYLNHLGYTNINAQQLKEFMIDLKKLMKYDQKHFSRRSKSKDRTLEQTSDTIPKRGNNCLVCDTNEANIFNTLYNQATFASKLRDRRLQSDNNHNNHDNKSKVISDSSKKITVQITRSKSENKVCESHPEHCVHGRLDQKQDGDADKGKNCQKDNQGTTSASSSTKLPKSSTEIASTSKSDVITDFAVTVTTRNDTEDVADASKSRKKCKSAQSTSSKSQGKGKTVNKCDPVALYQHYQSEWSKHRLPGEDNRQEVRWAIKEKMMEGPKVQTDRYFGRRRCNSVR